MTGTLKLTNATNEEQIWDYHNDLLYGGAAYQIIHEPLTGNWICSVNKTSVYFKKSGIGQDYWEKIALPQVNTYVQYVYPFTEKLLLVADQGMFLYPDIYNDQNNWIKIEFPQTTKTIEIIETQLPIHGKIYWMATNHGLYYSKDPSQYSDALFNWVLSDLSANVECKDLWFDSTMNQLIVLSADGWLYRSRELTINSQIAWEKIPIDSQIHTVQELIITKTPQRTWLISTQTQGVYRSDNEGISWKNISKELPNLYISQMKLLKNNLFISTYGGFFVYNLESEKWNKIGNSLFNEHINCFDIEASKSFIMVGTNGNGIWGTQYTTEDVIWKKNDVKIEGILVKKLLKNEQETKILLSTWGAGVYLSNNNGLSWKQTNQGLTNPYILSFFYESDQRIWAGTLNGGLFYSNDFGDTWNKIQSSTLLSQYFYSILVDRHNSNILYAGTDRTIFKSVNRGESWNQLNLGTEDHPVGNITALEQDISNPEIIYAGTDSSGLYYSKDSGETWYPSNHGLLYNSINRLVSLFHKNTILLAGTNGDGCYISYNQANSWEKLQKPEEIVLVYDMFVPKDKLYTDECFISAEGGFYKLNLNNLDFTRIGKSLYVGVRSSMLYQSKIWVGTYGKGIACLITLPKPPMPMDPPNLTQTTKTRIMFRWSETSFSEYPVLYRVQISQDTDFKTIFYESATISGDQWLIPDQILKRHTTYYWRVRGETSIGNTAWSKPYEFTVVTIIQMKINQPKLLINGETQNLDQDPGVVPIIRESRTFLPIRIVIESWEGNIQWNNALKQVMIELEQDKIILTIQKSEAIVNGKIKKIDNNSNVVPFLLKGRTMLPLRFIAENLHSQVEWEASTQTITLIYPGRET